MIKFISEVVAGALLMMVVVPINFVFLLFLSPFLKARELYVEGEYVGAAVMATIGSWPAWLTIYVLTKF
jgi:hypothetical protein